MHLDRMLDLLVQLFAAFDVLGRKPDPQVRSLHPLMQSSDEGFILGAVADEARGELDGLHRTKQRWEILDQPVGNAAVAQEYLGDFALR